MTLIDRWDGFDAMVEAADVAAFTYECADEWPMVTLDEANPVLHEDTWLAIAHDDVHGDEQVDYLPANLPA